MRGAARVAARACGGVASGGIGTRRARVQLISQSFRGWAWTRALLGVPAREIHVCGDQSAIEVVRSLCKVAGMPEPEVRRFERLTRLDVDEEGLLHNDYANVQPGDAVIGFSVLELFKIKAAIDRTSPYKAALVYGSLPPMARRQQAMSFNTPESGYEVRGFGCAQHAGFPARALCCARRRARGRWCHDEGVAPVATCAGAGGERRHRHGRQPQRAPHHLPQHVQVRPRPGRARAAASVARQADCRRAADTAPACARERKEAT